MNDFQRVALIQGCRSINIAWHNLAVELNYNARRTDVKLLQQPANCEAVLDFSRFTVYLNVHFYWSESRAVASVSAPAIISLDKIKNRVHADHPCGQGTRFKLSLRGNWLSRFPTPVLPGSGSKGCLVLPGSQSAPWQTPPATKAPLTKRGTQVNLLKLAVLQKTRRRRRNRSFLPVVAPTLSLRTTAAGIPRPDYSWNRARGAILSGRGQWASALRRPATFGGWVIHE